MGAFSDYVSQTQTTAAAAAPVPQFGSYQPPTDTRTGHGLFGMIGNLGADVKDFTSGLVDFAGMGLDDLVHRPADVAKEVFTMGIADTQTKVLTPDIVPRMVEGFAKDIKDRYWDHPIAQSVYDHPLSFLFDLATLAGGAGAVARAATGTGMVAGNIGRAILGAETVARNAELLSAYRAARLAGEAGDAVAGGLEAGKAVGLSEAAATAEAASPGSSAGILGAATQRLSGIETLSGLAKRWGSYTPTARNTMILDWLVPEPLKVADRMSGFTFDIAPNKNPLLRSVWSDPVRKRFLTEGIDTFRSQVGQLRSAEEAGLLEGSELQRLRQMETALGRMEKSGAQLVSKPAYATIAAKGAWKGTAASRFVERRTKQAVSGVLGRLMSEGMGMRREAQSELERILTTSGAPPDIIEGLHRELEGLGESQPVTLPRDILEQQLQAKGYPRVEDAARDYLYRTGNYLNLSPDEGTSLYRMARDGQIETGDLWRYKPDADLLPMGERTRFETEMRHAAEQVGLRPQHQDWLMMMYDSAARGLVRNSEDFASVNDVYRVMHTDFQELFDPGLGTSNPLLQHGGARAGAGGVPIERPLPTEALNRFVPRGAGGTLGGWKKSLSAASQKAIQRGEQAGGLSLEAGSKIADEIGVHPREIWGDAYREPVGAPLGMFTDDATWSAVNAAAADAASVLPKHLQPTLHSRTDFIERVRASLNNTLGPDATPYTTEEAAQMAWERTKQYIDDERQIVERQLENLTGNEKQDAWRYHDLLLEAMMEDQPAKDYANVWKELSRTRAGKNIQRRMGNFISSPQTLAQHISDEVLGATIFGPEFGTMMRFFRTGNFTTFVHEFGHVLRRLFPPEVSEKLWDVYFPLVHGDVANAPGVYQAADVLYQTERNITSRKIDRWASYDTTDGREIREGDYAVVKGEPGVTETGLGFTPEGQIGRVVEIRKRGEVQAKPAKGEKAAVEAKPGQMVAVVDVRGVGRKNIPIDQVSTIDAMSAKHLGLEGIQGYDWQAIEPGPRDTQHTGHFKTHPVEYSGVRYEHWTSPDGIQHSAGDVVTIDGKAQTIDGFKVVPNYEWRKGKLYVTHKIYVDTSHWSAGPYATHIDGPYVPAADLFIAPRPPEKEVQAAAKRVVEAHAAGASPEEIAAARMTPSEQAREATSAAYAPGVPPPGLTPEEIASAGLTPEEKAAAGAAVRRPQDRVFQGGQAAFKIQDFLNGEGVGVGEGIFGRVQMINGEEHVGEIRRSAMGELDIVDEHGNKRFLRWPNIESVQISGESIATHRRAFDVAAAERQAVTDQRLGNLPQKQGGVDVPAAVQRAKPSALKRLQEDIAKPVEKVPFTKEIDDSTLSAMDDYFTAHYSSPQAPLEAGTPTYQALKDQGVHITRKGHEFEVPGNLEVGTRVVFYGDDIAAGNIGTVVEMSPEEILHGNDGDPAKWKAVQSAKGEWRQMPVVNLFDDKPIAWEGNHRIERARRRGDKDIKVVLVGDERIGDFLGTGKAPTPTAAEVPVEAPPAREVRGWGEESPKAAAARVKEQAKVLGSESDAKAIARLSKELDVSQGEYGNIADHAATTFMEERGFGHDAAGARKFKAAWAKLDPAEKEQRFRAAIEATKAEAGAAPRDVQAEQAARGGLSTQAEQAAQDEFAARLAAETPPPGAVPAEPVVTGRPIQDVNAPVMQAAAPEPQAAGAGGPSGLPPEVPPAAAAGPPPIDKTKWTREMEEAFAKDLEAYFFGKAKNVARDRGLLPVFKMLSEYVMDQWSKVRGFVTEHDLVPKESKDVFDAYLGDTFRQFSQDSTGSVPASMYAGRRRTRKLGYGNLADQYGDGRDVTQILGVGGKVGAQELHERAVYAADPISRTLAQLFGRRGRGFVDSIKDIRTLTTRIEEGARVLDAYRARVIIGDWTEADAAVQKLAQGGFRIAGVEDLRSVPGEGGKRGLRAYVVHPDKPDLVAEIEIGTPLFNRFRESFYRHDQLLDTTARDLAKEQQALARVAAMDPNQAGVGASIDQHQKAVEALTAEYSAGKRVMEGNYEMIADEMGHSLGEATPLAPTRKMMNELRMWVGRRSEMADIESGYYNFGYALDRQYLPLKLESGATWDEELGDFSGGKLSTVMDEERAISGLPQPVYFPHIEKAGPLDYVTMVKGRQGARKLAENKNLRRNRGTLFAEGNYITDVKEAYSVRASRAIKQLETYRVYAKVTQMFGRHIAHPDDVLPGERLMAPDFVLAYFKAKIGIEDRMGALLSKMDDSELVGALNDLSRKTGETMAPDILAEGIRASLNVGERNSGALYLAVSEAMPKVQRQLIGVTRQGVDLYAVPAIVAKTMEDTSRYAGGTGVRLFVDTPMNMWRAFTLYGRPAWLINNLLGNTFFGAVGGVRLREVVHAAADSNYRFYVDQLGREANLGGEILQGFATSGDVLGTHLGAAAENTLSGQAATRLATRANKMLPVRAAKKWSQWIRQINGEIENASRRVGFVEGLRRAATETPGAGITLDAATVRRTAKDFWGSKEQLQKMIVSGISQENGTRGLQLMESWFGNYSNMSSFERNVIRRYIFPFWGFYRHIGKLLLQMPFEYPGKTTLLRSLNQVTDEIQKQYGPVPSWMAGMVPFGGVNGQGEQPYLSLAGPNPFNAFSDVGLSLFSPMIKASLEMLTGRDAFTGKEFTDPDVFTPFGSSQRFKIIRGANGQPVDAVPIDKVTPSLPVELLSQVPYYDRLKSLIAGGKTYDTVGLLGAAQQGPITDAQGQPIAPYGPGQFAEQNLAGLSVIPYDLQSYQAKLAQERENALMQAYERWAEQHVGSTVGAG